MQWPGSKPFTMWGYREGPVEATEEYHRAECAIRMLERFAKQQQPWHLEVHFVQPHDAYMPLKSYLDHYDPRSIPVPRELWRDPSGQARIAPARVGDVGHITEDDYRPAARTTTH